MNNGGNNRGRWADRPNTTSANEDDLAMAALLGEANKKSEEQEQQRQRQRPNNHRSDRNPQKTTHNRQQRNRDETANNYYGGGGGDKRVVEDDNETSGERDAKKRRRRWNDREEDVPIKSDADATEAAPTENPNKVKADFGLSGALAGDTVTGNVHNGITLKFSQPPEARIPNTRWRLYVFRKKEPHAENKKDDGLLDTYHISRQSAYLFGRERKVADIPVDHPSLSKQHAVLQYRSLPSKQQVIGEGTKLQCKPYLLDLESTNGTFINGVRLDSARYYELRRGDVITLGASSREYVLLTEQSSKTGI